MPKRKTKDLVETVIEKIDQRRQSPRGKGKMLPYGCDKCDGYGNIITENGATQCECKLQYLSLARVRASNIPNRFVKKNFSNFETPTAGHTAIFKMAREYVKNYSPDHNDGLLFIGGPGVGKTHLAVSILRELILKGYDGVFYNMNDLLDILRATFNASSETREQDILDDLMMVDILVLDDVGAQEKLSPYVLDRFYTLVNGRYQQNKTLIITTNLSQSTLELRLNHRTISRLYEMCDVRQLAIDQDYRQATFHPSGPHQTGNARGMRKK